MSKEIKVNRTLAKKVLKVVDAGLSHGLGKPKPGEMCVEAAVCYALGLPHNDDPPCVSRAVRSLKITLNDQAWSSNEARAKGMRRLAIIQLGTSDLDDVAFAKAVAEMTIKTIVPAALMAAAKIPCNAHSKDTLLGAAKRCSREGTYDAASDAARAASYAASDAASDAARAASYAASDAASYAASAASYAASDVSYAASDAASYAASAASYAASAASYAASAASYAASDVSYVRDAARAASYAARAARDARDATLSKFAEGVVQVLVGMGVKAAVWLDLAPLDNE